MAKKKDKARAAELRKRAEEILAEKPGAFRALAPADVQKLIHELNVYQIELELQNDELRRTQLELQEARDKYLNLYDFAPTGYFTLDRNGIIVDVNLAGSELLGSEKHRLIGTQFISSISPDSQDAFYFYHRELLKTGTKSSCELKILKADGTLFPAQLISMAMPEKDGNINQFRTAVIDITERKQAEDALRQSEERYRTLFETMAQGVVYQSADGKIFSANSAAERILGLTLGQMQGRTSMDPRWKAIHEDGSDFPGETHPAIIALKTGKEGKDVVMGVFNPGDEQYHWISIYATPQFIPGESKPYQVYTTFADVTERKQSEETIKESEEKFRSLVESTSDWIWEINLDGVYTYASPKIKGLLGYEPEEVVGKTPFDFMPAEEANRVASKFKDIIKNSKPIEGLENTCRHKDGHLVILETGGVPVFDIKGQLRGYRGVDRDITERKIAEEERMRLELKAQATSRLASVGEMAAGVAHEINNPLTAVIGYAQLLMEREDIPPDIRADLVAINDGAQRVAGIIQRLLAFSRQTKPQRKLVDINELIESTLVLRAYHLKVNNIEVVTRLAPDLLETVADPGQIQQVLLNLIVNAEMEMKLAHGKGKLTITTEKSDNTIKICCQDNGPGIKPEVMDKIFDPFFTTREVGQGTGLGLSLCYGIVAEHKGKIYAESKLGKGATFIVELPVVTEVEPPKPAEPVVKKSQKKVKARILVVDDEQVVRDVVNRVLTGEGHKVETVDNAADALKKIESKRYKLILVDIKMPGMNGVTLYKRIQKIDESLARRVAFITGDIMSADTEKFLSEAKVAHIEKPFDAEQLSREVQRALAAGR